MKAGTVALRPWGQVSWVIDKLPGRMWSYLGCLGAEERSLGLWEYLRAFVKLDKSILLKIQPSSLRYAQEYEDRIKLRASKLQHIGEPSGGVAELGLFASDAELVAVIDQFASTCAPHVILDFTCLPKRFFFPFVKRLLTHTKIETLIATYTVPEHYLPLPGLLAEDHLAIAHLPLFGPSQFPEKKVDMVIVTAGFMRLGLAELLEPYKNAVSIRTILPFPPGLPAYHRNWEFIRETLPAGSPPPIRVSAYDCPDAFDHLIHLTKRGAKNAIFAPFGPKPLSLAICLFAALTRQVVYYTQPTVYNPDYSAGIRKWGGSIGTHAYVLRVNGTDTYSIK